MYKGYEIYKELGGYTVFYQGDEVWFASEDEAREFIDEVA